MRVEQAFRQYIGAVFEYLRSSETCLVRGWPDKRMLIRDAMWSAFGNITSIWGRIHDGWQSSEEVTLKKNNPAYDGLATEIDKLHSALDPKALDGPFRDAQRDKEYLDARDRMQDRVRELDSELATSSAGSER
jgi:hypothetical protein